LLWERGASLSVQHFFSQPMDTDEPKCDDSSKSTK
jgi:hypothetical protein